MSKKVRSVRVPKELETMNLSGLIHECEKHLRDLESATLLKQQGNQEAAEASCAPDRPTSARRSASSCGKHGLNTASTRENK